MHNTYRINVVGSSGSGKSTVAKALAKKLGRPLVQLDQLFWRSNWTNVSDIEMAQLIKKNLDQPQWVLDGNFNKYESIKWEHVQMVVWVDTSFIVNLWQVVRRSIQRAISKEEIWPGTGCRESFHRSFFNKESIILWVINTWSSYRKTYQAHMNSEEHSYIQWVRLRNRKEVQVFLGAVP